MAASGPMRDRVIAHADELHLSDVEFCVSQVRRQRAQQTGQRNAHAFAVGTLLDSDVHASTDAHRWNATRATYRYKRHGTVVTANYEDAVYHAAFADFRPDGQMLIRTG